MSARFRPPVIRPEVVWPHSVGARNARPLRGRHRARRLLIARGQWRSGARGELATAGCGARATFGPADTQLGHSCCRCPNEAVQGVRHEQRRLRYVILDASSRQERRGYRRRVGESAGTWVGCGRVSRSFTARVPCPPVSQRHHHHSSSAHLSCGGCRFGARRMRHLLSAGRRLPHRREWARGGCGGSLRRRRS